MIAEFLTWWGGQLRALLPASFQAAAPWRDAAILDIASSPPVLRTGTSDPGEMLAPDDAGLETIGHALRAVGRAPGQGPGQGPGRALLLRVPSAWLLEQKLALPPMAARDIEDVLRLDIDRATPFAPHEIVWTWRMARPAGRAGNAASQLRVVLSVLPLAPHVQPWLDRLAQAGCPVDAIEAIRPNGARLFLPMSAPAGLSTRSRSARLPRALAGVCAGLALLAIVLPFAWQQVAFGRVDATIARLRPQVEQVGRLRARIDGEDDGTRALRRAGQEAGDVIEAIAVVTAILPDNSFLTNFSLNHRHLALAGQSTDAAGLITALSASPQIRAPSFAAPVTTTPDGRASLFEIRAMLAP